MKKFKRVVSFILAFVMSASLFTNWPLHAFAVDGTATTLTIPDGATLTKSETYTEYAYIASDEVHVYVSHENGSEGMIYTGLAGEKIELSQTFTYSLDGVDTVLYYFSAYDFEGTVYDIQNAGYRFIPATDVTFTAPETEATPTPEVTPTPEATATPEPETTPETTPEVTPAPEVTTTPTPEATATPEPEATPETSPEPEATPEATATPTPETTGITLSGLPETAATSVDVQGRTAEITVNPVILYKSLDNGAEGVSIEVETDTEIQLVTQYTFTTDAGRLVFYRYDYSGDNADLSSAALSETSGYVFIPAESISVGETLTNEATGVAVSGTLPRDVALTVTEETAETAGLGSDIFAIGENSLFYDVTLSQNGAEYQPETITITFPEGKIPFAQGAYYNVYHVHGETVTTTGPYLYNGGDISATFNGLSAVGIAEDATAVAETTTTVTITHTSTGIAVTGNKEQLAPVTTITATRVTTPPAGTEDYLIWNTSVFYDVTLTDTDGNEVTPVDGVDVTFPATVVSAAFAEGTDYNAYHFNNDGTVDVNGTYTYESVSDAITMHFESLSVVGVAKKTEISSSETATDIIVTPKESTIKLYDNLYLDLVYGQEVAVAAGTDTFAVEEKVVVTDGTDTVELYLVAVDGYTGDNTEINGYINTDYPYILCSDVEEYIPVEDIPTVDGTVLESEETGITVTGSLPAGTKLHVTEMTADAITAALTTEDYTYPQGNKVVGYDIKLMYNGEEYQPEKPVTVDFTADDLGFDAYTGYVTYHIHDGIVYMYGPTKSTGGALSMTVDGFSQFIFANLFTEAGDYKWTGTFNKDNVTVYDSFLADGYAYSYTLTNGTEYQITTSQYYRGYNDENWYLLRYGIQDEEGFYYSWVKAEDIFTEIVDEDTGITVTGLLPTDVTSSVVALSEDDMSLNTNVYGLGEDTVAYDISLQQNGSTYTLDDSVDVRFPASMFSAEEGTSYTGYHVHDDGTVDILGQYEYTGEDMVITVNSFSEFIFTETNSQFNMDDNFGTSTTDSPVYFDTELVATFIDDSANIYTDYYGTATEAVVEGIKGEEIRVIAKIEYSKGKTLYFFDYYGDNTDLADAIYNYQFIPADEVDFGYTDDTTGIKVLGEFPYEATLSLAETNHSLDTSVYPLGAHTKIFDISVMYDGAKYQPAKPVTLVMPKDVFEFTAGNGLAMYHVHDDNTVDIIGPVYYGGNGIELTVDSFSQFVFSDTFAQRSNKDWVGLLYNDEVAFYSDIFPQSTTYTLTNAVDTVVKGSAYYVAADGTEWMMLDKAVRDADGNYYAWIKAEDIVFLKYEGERLVPTVDYTEVAPLQSPSATTYTEMMSYALMPLGTEDETTESGNGLEIRKSISEPDKDGNYTITLEAWVTGAVRNEAKSMPTDIVLVLDQSGSMDDPIGSLRYSGIDVDTAENIYLEHGDTTYIKVGDAYYPVTITPKDAEFGYKLIDSSGSNKNFWDFYNDDDNGDIYYKVDENTYYKVTITRSGNNSSRRTYTYSYVDSSGVTHTLNETNDNGDCAWADRLYSYEQTKEATTYYFDYVTTVNGAPVINRTEIAAGTNIPANTYYTRTTNNNGEDRLDALVTAVTNFAAEVAKDAAGKDGKISDVTGVAADDTDNIDHTISITGFASAYSWDWDTYYYGNTELFVGGDQYTYNGGAETSDGSADEAQAHYADAPQNMTTQDGIDNITRSIAAISADGGTFPSYALEMANGIFDTLFDADNERYVKGGKTIRNKVIILFTDGHPGWNSSNYNESEANRAITQAKTAKDGGATIYTIGVFAGADARMNISADKTTAKHSATDTSNEFMHFVSSNYKNATSMSNPGTETFPKTDTTPPLITGASYYLSASDSESLNNIFQQLATAVGGAGNTTLTGETTVRDIVTPYFKIPDNVAPDDIVVKTAAYEFDETKKTADFADPVDFDANVEFPIVYKTDTEGNKTVVYETDADGNIVYETDESGNFVLDDNGQKIPVPLRDRKTINVTNFDFSANWVGTETGTDGSLIGAHGKKLIIEIPVIAEPFFLGGNNVVTNEADSGVYDPAGVVVDNFTPQHADVEIIDIDIQWADQHIYQTNNANIDTLFKNATVKSRYTDDIETLANVLNGVNNDYVNIEFTVTEKESGAVIGTYTVPAGQTLNDGSWDVRDGVDIHNVPVSEDTVYELTWKITPTVTSGTAKEVNHTTPVEATVYVYNPVLTFQDTEKNYGDERPDYTDENYVSAETVWKHGDTLSTTVDMHGDEPDLTLDYAEVGDVLDANNNIATGTDFYVNVTVKVGTTDITGYTTFVHKDCDIVSDCDPEEGPGTFDPTIGEFIIHIRTMPLTITKQAYAGTTFETGETFIFNVTGTSVGVTDHINMTVVISGEGSITIDNLPVGNYTVTEDISWSYRYDVVDEDGNAASASQEITLGDKDEVIFINKAKDDKWLHDESYAENAFTVDGVVAETIKGTATQK